ncbi:MAG: hypothetical protein ACRD26_09455 [Vicinamibacterales bacterium]
MPADRYLKCILTIIALELLWLGVRDASPPVMAQPAPAPVVVTGFRIGGQEYTTLPVAVVGGVQPLPGVRELPGIEPLRVRVPESLQVDTRQPLRVQVGNQPITVQTGTKPLLVDAVPAKPGARPGL